MQEESEHFVNSEDRLDRLRVQKGFTWDELATYLDLSRTMLHYVRKGERDLSAKAALRMRDAEKNAGLIAVDLSQSLAVVREAGAAYAAIRSLEERAKVLMDQCFAFAAAKPATRRLIWEELESAFTDLKTDYLSKKQEGAELRKVQYRKKESK